ncbi:hypothetical protein RPD76_03895 [Methylomonas sp. MV1]|uniref:hypothetical protein n=1 Tax=Methylomonas sp. MV1 TaxID=3073620 RepID=UPI0028A4B3A5|nr:hypothetical protein [Methylomonas sp. MV1]MDT4329033.1 hypothetical protein [Methylomonas sp. MV1]
MSDIVRDDDAGGIGPRAFTDAVAGIDGGLAAAGLGAEIRMPGSVTGIDRAGQLLAMSIGAG